MREILHFLTLNGEQLDSQIATGTGLAIPDVRRTLADLAVRGDVITCRVIRALNGKETEETLYRAAAYSPMRRPARKTKAQTLKTKTKNK